MMHDCMNCKAFRAVGIETECPDCERRERNIRRGVNVVVTVFMVWGAATLFIEALRRIK